MTRRTGFTLVEAVVVVAATAVLGVVLVATMGGCGSRGGIPARSRCKTNIANIGKGLAVYTGSYNDQWPWLISDNKWDAATGASQTAGPSAGTTYNVSAILFVLVRDNQAPGIFVCPSTADTPDPNTKTGANYNWDFSPFRSGGAEHVSYSYQAPIRDPNGAWHTGVDSRSDSGLIILADRTPTYDGLNATFNWGNPGGAAPATGMSQNHEKGEMVNLLFQDLHVGDSTGRADAGINNDSIYSCANSQGDPPTPETSQGPGTLDLTKHSSPKDSFLLGPKKMP